MGLIELGIQRQEMPNQIGLHRPRGGLIDPRQKPAPDNRGDRADHKQRKDRPAHPDQHTRPAWGKDLIEQRLKHP